MDFLLCSSIIVVMATQQSCDHFLCRSIMALTLVSSNKCAGGFQKVFEHDR